MPWLALILVCSPGFTVAAAEACKGTSFQGCDIATEVDVDVNSSSSSLNLLQTKMMVSRVKRNEAQMAAVVALNASKDQEEDEKKNGRRGRRRKKKVEAKPEVKKEEKKEEEAGKEKAGKDRKGGRAPKKDKASKGVEVRK